MKDHGGQPKPGVFLNLECQAGLQFLGGLGGLGGTVGAIHPLENLLFAAQRLVQLIALWSSRWMSSDRAWIWSGSRSRSSASAARRN